VERSQRRIESVRKDEHGEKAEDAGDGRREPCINRRSGVRRARGVPSLCATSMGHVEASGERELASFVQ
jgi:hypothetical protein